MYCRYFMYYFIIFVACICITFTILQSGRQITVIMIFIFKIWIYRYQCGIPIGCKFYLLILNTEMIITSDIFKDKLNYVNFLDFIKAASMWGSNFDACLTDWSRDVFASRNLDMIINLYIWAQLEYISPHIGLKY